MDFNGLSDSQRLPLQPEGLVITTADMLEDIRSRSMHSVAELTTLIASQSPSDYSYFDLAKLKLHDLPKHLKQVANRLMAERQLNSETNAIEPTKATTAITTVRNRKEIPKLDFGIVSDRSKFFKVTKNAIFLGDRTLDKRSEKPFRFETERQYDF